MSLQDKYLQEYLQSLEKKPKASVKAEKSVEKIQPSSKKIFQYQVVSKKVWLLVRSEEQIKRVFYVHPMVALPIHKADISGII